MLGHSISSIDLSSSLSNYQEALLSHLSLRKASQVEDPVSFNFDIMDDNDLT